MMPRSSTYMSTGVPQLRSQAVSRTVCTTPPMRRRSQRPVPRGCLQADIVAVNVGVLRRQASIVVRAASAGQLAAWQTAPASRRPYSWPLPVAAPDGAGAALSLYCSMQSQPLDGRQGCRRTALPPAPGPCPGPQPAVTAAGDRPQQALRDSTSSDLAPRARAGGATSPASRRASATRAHAPPDRGDRLVEASVPGQGAQP
jgi:hypothetical protein